MRKYLEKVAQTTASIEVDAELRLQNRAYETTEVQTFGYVQVTLQFIAQSEATSRPVSVWRVKTSTVFHSQWTCRQNF